MAQLMSGFIDGVSFRNATRRLMKNSVLIASIDLSARLVGTNPTGSQKGIHWFS
jgi:hypothetical protein